METNNLYRQLPRDRTQENFETLLQTEGLRLERIVSFGQAGPPGEWSDQERGEWVVVLTGAARVLFDGEPQPHALGPGDWLHIPAHRRHRVEWTAPGEPTIWLALHYT